MHKGIDYGRGLTNIDLSTGIRFGVIHSNRLGGFWGEEFEYDYGEPACPKCGGEAVDYVGLVAEHGEYAPNHRGSCREKACEGCGIYFGNDEAFGDEAVGADLNDGAYKARLDFHGDVFVLKSPHKTRAAFCSPCAPGACHLEHPDPDGEWCYCLGGDWFEGGVPPYDVYSVATGELVERGATDE